MADGISEPRTLLGKLAKKILEHNAMCPWPGPWTLGSSRRDQLVGRDDDIDDLVYQIRDHSLTVLSGDSGVGKSSLLLAGLIPALEIDGFKVLVCRNWRDNRSKEVRGMGRDGLSEFFRAKFLADPSNSWVSNLGSGDLVAQLNGLYGGEAVLVLDQFEEVIRQQPQLFADICDWIEGVVEHSQVRVVISLRSEEVHRLTDLRVGAYRRMDHAIPAIRAEELVRQIVASGLKGRAVEGQDSEGQDVASLVAKLWLEAFADRRRSRISLLHLQALLYSIWASLDGAEITPSAVREFLANGRVHAALHVERGNGLVGSAHPSDRDLAVGVFDWALANVVRVHVELCERLFTSFKQFDDRPLQEGVLHALVRLAEHLSSGGYKVDQEEVHLAELVLADKLQTLGFLDESEDGGTAEEDALRVIRAFARMATGNDFDWASAPTQDLVVELQVADPRIARIGLLRPGVTAGALLGTSSKVALVEECRRFFIALEWLRLGALVRASPSDDERNFLSLSHDGFGRGLNEWADTNDKRPQTALYAVTAAFGQAFNWPVARTPDAKQNPLYCDDEEQARLFVNLRWRSCRIMGSHKRKLHIRNVVFMNCDFRGTTFQYCALQGVVFINCLMDGVQFDDCQIVGRVSSLEHVQPSTTQERELPSFLVPDQDQVVATLNHYQVSRPDTATSIYSETSGQSVRVVEKVPDAAGGTRDYQVTTSQITGSTDRQHGGLVLYGGRLSSLAFYRCEFQEEAAVSLRYVAGTSLDFFEHRGGRVELYDVALRGVTVSPPITSSLRGAGTVHVEFEAVNSHLENVWFSAGLEGEAVIRSSVVWQLFNGSQRSDGSFRVGIDPDSLWLGVQNVPDNQVLGTSMSQAKPGDADQWFSDTIREFVGRIDYRSPEEDRAYREILGDRVSLLEVLEEE